MLFFRSKEPGERNDSIDKKHVSRHILPKRKKPAGKIPICELTTAVALSITSTLASLRSSVVVGFSMRL